jgi:hypothetical protein
MSDSNRPEYYQMDVQCRDGKTFLCFYAPDDTFVAEIEMADSDSYLTPEMLEVISGDERFQLIAPPEN